MPRILSSLLVAFAILLSAPQASMAQNQAIRLNAPFDPGLLTRQELRIVQAALVLENAYTARVDGAWGEGSRRALDVWLRENSRNGQATWGQIRRLVRIYQSEHQASGWREIWHEDQNLWHMRPDGILQHRDSERGTRLATADAGLIVTVRGSTRRPDNIHQSVLRGLRRGTQPTQVDRDAFIVTSAELEGGRSTHVRSDFYDGTWITHIVIADQFNRPRLQLIASTFERGEQPTLEVRPRGVLNSLLAMENRDERPVQQRPATSGARMDNDTLTALLRDAIEGRLDRLFDVSSGTPQPDPRPRGRDRVNRATGAYVNTTDLVTSAEFVDRCDRIVTSDGTPLREIVADRRAGLAVLASSERSSDWLALGEAAPRRGDELTVLSPRPADDRLRVRRGALTSGGRADDPRHDIDLRGRAWLGAPVLGRDGGIVGVQTSVGGRQRYDGLDDLRAVLRDAGIPFSDERRPDAALGRDVPGGVQAAVVALRCQR